MGVTDDDAPTESEGVRVGVDVGVSVMELDAVEPKEIDAVGVILGVGVEDDEGVVEGAADKPKPAAVRTQGVPPFGFVALMEGT